MIKIFQNYGIGLILIISIFSGCNPVEVVINHPLEGEVYTSPPDIELLFPSGRPAVLTVSLNMSADLIGLGLILPFASARLRRSLYWEDSSLLGQTQSGSRMPVQNARPELFRDDS